MDIDDMKAQIVEQMDMLWMHKEQGPMLNFVFIRDHAHMLFELSEQMLPSDQRMVAKLRNLNDLPKAFTDPDPGV